MNKNYFYTSMLLSFLFAVIVFHGCAKEKSVQAPPLKPLPQAGELLVSPASLRQADLEIDFSNFVPVQSREKLKFFDIIDSRLYAVTGRNYLVSLDRKKADPVYSWQLASASATFSGLKKYDDQLYSIVGADLVSLDQQDGKQRLNQPLGFGPICPPARNKDFYYVPGTDRRVHVMNSSDMVSIFDVSANDNGAVVWVGAEDDFVAFATDAGTLAAMTPDRPEQLWRFEADAAINAPVVYDGSRIIFSSKDAYVYAIDRYRGRLIWKYLTPAILTHGPKVTQNYVYQYVGEHGLFAINKVNGELAWQLPEGIDLLAENGNKVYIMAENKKLVVFDDKKMTKLYEVDVPAVTKWASNTVDSRIYLADDTGRIACIKPIEY
jgi:outer membrane protein assembly factor BamB